MKVAGLNNTIKTIQTVTAVFLVILILSSCQKEVTGDIDPSTTPSTTTSKVKTYTEDATSNGVHVAQTFNLTYDSNDRLVSLISTTTPGDKIIYTYNSDNTYTMDLYSGNVLSIHELFFLNNLPFVDSTVQYDTYSMDTTTEKYIYNSNKQLVTLKEYEYSKASGSTLINTIAYTANNLGNVVTETHLSGTITYDYYTDLTNNLSIGMIYFQQSKNLVKTTTYIIPNAPNTVTTHTYTFDSEKRITSQKDVYSNGDIVIKTYTY